MRAANLRSGYIQDDVEQYLYELLPERDAVVNEMELYAEEHHVPIIGPAVARLLALFAQEGLWCDVASGGELHLALQAGFAPDRIVVHGNERLSSG